jgi:exonuclease VII large subunit
MERLKLSQLTSTLTKKAERPSIHFIGIISRATAMIQGKVLPRVSGQHRGLDQMRSRLSGLISSGFSARLSSLDRIEATLSRRDPAKMLALGWSMALDATGKPISSVSSVSPRDTVHVKLSDGKLRTRVEKVEKT